MFSQKTFDEFSAKISDAIAASPLKDIEKNIHAIMMSTFSRLDLVTREEFDIQRELLSKTIEQMDKANVRLNDLEKCASQHQQNSDTKPE